jgi:hypothetical protein
MSRKSIGDGDQTQERLYSFIYFEEKYAIFFYVHILSGGMLRNWFFYETNEASANKIICVRYFFSLSMK